MISLLNGNASSSTSWGRLWLMIIRMRVTMNIPHPLLGRVADVNFLAILLMIMITATLLRAELLPGGSLSSSTFVLPSNGVSPPSMIRLVNTDGGTHDGNDSDDTYLCFFHSICSSAQQGLICSQLQSGEC